MNRTLHWTNEVTMTSREYKCGYCGNPLVSEKGYPGQIEGNSLAFIYVCHYCGSPTFFDDQESTQTPGIPFGNKVKNITDEGIIKLYDEARNCCKTNSYTAAVLSCRKLLMNIAVSKDAPKGQKFVYYVKYLVKEGYVPTGGEKWVDQIRKIGNDANHEIALMKPEDAKLVLSFTEMLLKIIYEFPEMIPKENDEKPEKEETEERTTE